MIVEILIFNLSEKKNRVSLNLPTVEVRFENVNVTTEAFVGSRAVPTVINSYVTVAKVNISFLLRFLGKQETSKKPIGNASFYDFLLISHIISMTLGCCN